MKQIFPKEIIESTIEVHQFKHHVKSQIVYILMLLFVSFVFTSLPFIKISVYTTSRGILKPNKERLPLTLISSGEVLMTNLKNNLKVNKGDTLLTLNNENLREEILLSTFQKNEISNHIKDLEYLINENNINSKKIITSKYLKEYLLFKQTLNELELKFEKASRDFQRNSTLYQKNVISKVEYETSEFDLNITKNSIQNHISKQINSWQLNLTNSKKQFKELSSNNKRLKQNKKSYVLIAPIKGTLLNIRGLDQGAFINQGVELGEISPDTDLIVECYISPNDIGLINEDKTVKFQIDTFNYNQWGLVTGEIIEIGNDIVIVDENPVFKIKCKINNKYLELKNGFKGYLKKGMTLNARFELAERTVFDLLYDNVNDWMNPSIK